MKYVFITLCFVLSSFGTIISAQSLDSPAGRWKAIDEETGKANSIIEIYEENGTYAGKIADILKADKTAVCTKCKGKQKGAPMLGLVIIKGLKANKDYWDGGTIMDPQKGADYRLSVWYEDKDPNVLYVRGKHWTGLYRTQKWVRAK